MNKRPSWDIVKIVSLSTFSFGLLILMFLRQQSSEVGLEFESLDSLAKKYPVEQDSTPRQFDRKVVQASMDQDVIESLDFSEPVESSGNLEQKLDAETGVDADTNESMFRVPMPPDSNSKPATLTTSDGRSLDVPESIPSTSIDGESPPANLMTESASLDSSSFASPPNAEEHRFGNERDEDVLGTDDVSTSEAISNKPNQFVPIDLGAKESADIHDPVVEYKTNSAVLTETETETEVSSQVQSDESPVILPSKNSSVSGLLPESPCNDETRGRRDSEPTYRHAETADYFNEDQHYPKFSEILSTGRYFYSAEARWVRPNLNGDSAVTIESPGYGLSESNDYSFTPSFQLEAGFMSEYGPGFGFNYFQIDTDSKLSQFTSDGVQAGTTQVYSQGSNAWTGIVASNAGESLLSHTSVELHSFGFKVFKALKFKRASLTGMFGARTVRLNQSMTSTLLDPAGMALASLTHSLDYSGFGPTFGFLYTRRVGHTSLKVLTSITNSVLFGNRDQFLSNTYSNEYNNFSSNEVVSVVDLFSGLEGRKMLGEKRYVYGRIGFANETWIGGGTAIDPRANFGFQGVSFTLGINR